MNRHLLQACIFVGGGSIFSKDRAGTWNVSTRTPPDDEPGVEELPLLDCFPSAPPDIGGGGGGGGAEPSREAADGIVVYNGRAPGGGGGGGGTFLT